MNDHVLMNFVLIDLGQDRFHRALLGGPFKALPV